MNLSNTDKNFISTFLSIDGDVSIENACRSYSQAVRLISKRSEELKKSLSPEQMNIYQQELENRDEAKEILKYYYFSIGLKLYSHITEITNNPSAFIDAMYGDIL